MAENVTLARPYAEAAFQLAKAATEATSALGSWQEALDRMAAAAADAQMRDCISNPRLQPGQLAQLFLDVVGSVSAEQQNFVRLLVENERLQVLPEIRELYVELKNGQEGVKEADTTAWCRRVVAEHRRRKEAVPGYGHGLHKPDDPRTPPLLKVARETGLDGQYVKLLLQLQEVIVENAGRHVTINATGALAALLLEIGIPPDIVRAIAVVSRCGGLVGHILEEQRTDSTRLLVRLARDNIPYEDPTG